MWKRVVVDARVPYPPERVFPYLADPARWPEFAPAVAFRQRVGEGPPEVGSRWWAVDRIGPFRVRFADELESVQPAERVVWHSTSPWNSRVEYVCTPDAGGTRVRACYEGDIAGWLALTALLPGFAWRRILTRDFHGLTRLLDAEDAGAGEPRRRAAPKAAAERPPRPARPA